MNPVYDFKGQVALVTGAAKGMGLATARMFVQSGASVVLADLERRAPAGGWCRRRDRSGHGLVAPLDARRAYLLENGAGVLPSRALPRPTHHP
jgi:NAD(P)-dependent dehydrogenase (short-subunit alcohol dehydrogenase family)